MANWVVADPSSGSGDKEVYVSSYSEHTGRTARSAVLTWKAVNCSDVSRTVIQAGKPENVDIADSISSEKEGKTVTVTGVSNSSLLTFSLGTGDLDIELPSTYMANSVETVNGEAIVGDPGASVEYNFSIAITVPANEDTVAKTRQIIVTDNAGNQDVCLLTLIAGDAYLEVTEGDINLDYLGTPVVVNVSSNTNWTIE